MDRQGAIHEGIELRYDGQGHRIDFAELCGRAIMVYGQQEVVKDLIAARREADQPLHFEVEDVRVDPETHDRSATATKAPSTSSAARRSPAATASTASAATPSPTAS